MCVTVSESLPQIGQIVRILKGREAGKLAIVIRLEDERFIWVADGDKRKFDSPKKKNIRHIECFEYVSSIVQGSIQETGRVTNGKLRYALNKITEVQNVTQEKGE